MDKYPFLVDIPADEYHKAARDGKFLSSHLLGDFRRSPLLYKKKMTGEISNEETAAFLLGRATHTLVLEGRGKFEEEFLVSDGPVNPKTGESFGKLTKAYKDWAREQKLPIISGADYSFILKLREAVWRHEYAAAILNEGVAEKTVRTKYCGVNCQIRMDWFKPATFETRPLIGDLKTCDNIDFFESDARKFGYPEQLSFYREVFMAAGAEEVPECYLIAVEKHEPFRVAVYLVCEDILQMAKAKNEKAIERLRKCLKEEYWPMGTEGLRTLHL